MYHKCSQKKTKNQKQNKTVKWVLSYRECFQVVQDPHLSRMCGLFDAKCSFDTVMFSLHVKLNKKKVFIGPKIRDKVNMPQLTNGDTTTLKLKESKY